VKLLNCTKCHDIVALLSEWRSCRCSESYGRYDGYVDVAVGGPARILCIRNSDYKDCVPGKEYTWWALPPNHKKVSVETRKAD